MLSHAAFPAIAFGEPGSSGRGLHLTGALDPVSIECSTECLTFRKSGLVRDGNCEMRFWYLCGIWVWLLSFLSGSSMDWMAQTWKKSQSRLAAGSGAGADVDAIMETFDTRGKVFGGTFINSSSILLFV